MQSLLNWVVRVEEQAANIRRGNSIIAIQYDQWATQHPQLVTTESILLIDLENKDLEAMNYAVSRI